MKLLFVKTQIQRKHQEDSVEYLTEGLNYMYQKKNGLAI